jgi:pantoate--beta-alanine ligase
MKLTETWHEARAAIDKRGTVGLVPTMGFLHEAHAALFEMAVSGNDVSIASIFVNPLQFNKPHDLTMYPRDLDRDLEIAGAAGIDVVFAPSVEEMYPADMSTNVSMGAVATKMEGEYRPGHFDGVATVVTKLLAGVRPDRAYFGKKDAQQLAVVRTLARDFSFPVTIEGCSTLRESDGLALSSRNVRLDPAHRSSATSLSRGLMAAADLVDSGTADAPALIAAVASELAKSGVEADYIELASQESGMPIGDIDRSAFLAVAAWVGEVRLIDNIHIDTAGNLPVVDRGVALSTTSILYGGAVEPCC